MKAPAGKEIVMKLAARCDIVIENFRPGVVKKLGIAYDDLRQVNPTILYASMSGFGQTGPYGRKGGFDIIAQGMSGIMMMTGHPGGRPAKVGIAMNDIACGVTTLYASWAPSSASCATARASTWNLRCWKPGWPGSIWEFGAYFGGGELPTAPARGIVVRRPTRRIAPGRLRHGRRQRRQAVARVRHAGGGAARSGWRIPVREEPRCG